MAKCENCYHAEICKNYPNTGLPQKLRNELLDKCCEHYKDKSIIIELPCMADDVLYTLQYDYDRCKRCIEKVKCTNIEITIYCETIDEKREIYVPDDFGECVFISREDADRMLELLQLEELYKGEI